MMFDFGKIFNGMFRPIGSDQCRISLDGQLAVKTRTGYKTFDRKKMKLVNCDNLAINVGNVFWLVPTFKVQCGDIILVDEKPRAVIEVGEKTIKTFSYENSTIDEIVPERHVFMGKTYCYGKIFNPFTNFGKGDGETMSNMMNFVMMSQMLGGNTNGINAVNNMGNMLPMMFMMNGGKDNPFTNIFEGAFNFGEAEEEEVKEEN